MVRQPFAPSEHDRKMVQLGVACGASRPAICKFIINNESGQPISIETLNKYFHEELEHGIELTKLDLHGSLYQQAMKGNTYAAIFLLKAKHGWRDSEPSAASSKGRTFNADGTPADTGGGGMLILPADDDRVTWEQRTIEAQAKLVTVEKDADV